MQAQCVSLSGGPVSYLQHGEGFPLLLLHGWGGSARYWHSTLEHLADCRCGYALDLPGYGLSPAWPATPDVQGAAAVVLEFANAMGLERFDLNGHSFSATIAALVAVAAPHRVRRLVFTCASTYRNEMERRIAGLVHHILGLWLRLRRPWMSRTRWLYRPVAGRFFYQIPASDTLPRQCFEDFLRMDERTALAHARDVARPGYRTMLRHIAAPALVVGARQDIIMPATGTPMVADLLPNSRLIWIEHCGHLPMLERPHEYAHLLREFLCAAS